MDPPGICENTLGNTSKTNAGPDAGSFPNANTAGNTIKPPSIATPASIKPTHSPEVTILFDLGR